MIDISIWDTSFILRLGEESRLGKIVSNGVYLPRNGINGENPLKRGEDLRGKVVLEYNNLFLRVFTRLVRVFDS